MFCFGCPLASRAPLVRIQDIAMAKNLTVRGLQDEQGFLDNFDRNLVKFGNLVLLVLFNLTKPQAAPTAMALKERENFTLDVQQRSFASQVQTAERTRLTHLGDTPPAKVRCHIVFTGLWQAERE